MNLFKLVQAALSALKQGKELENPEAWKTAQAVTNFLVLFVVILKAAGVDLHLQDDTIDALISYAGTAIYALVNGYLAIATSKRVGIAITGENK